MIPNFCYSSTMFRNTLLYTLASISFQLIGAQLVGDGQCPDVKVIEKFRTDRYIGKWYEYARYPVIFETDGKCVVAQYSLQDDQTIRVQNTMINEKTGERRQIIGYAKPVENAKLSVTFPVNKLFNVTGSYWVLGTDYINYSVVYACKLIPTNITATTAWILTRAPVPTAEAVQAAESVFRSNNIALEPLEKTDQNSCDRAD